MLHLVTGLPGHGKTLYTLAHVEQLRRDTGRTVYYHGISELTLPWQRLDDPKLWYQLPEGSIIVLDEAYTTFPKRGSAAAVPKHVELVATHRHKGFDLFLVTQHAHNQLDHFIRGPVGKHFHVRRVFGSNQARVTTWERCANPDISFEQKDALKSWFKYPREVFTWYKSAEIHTHGRSVPWKVVAGVAALVLALPVLFFGGYASLVGNAEDAASAAQGPSLEASPGEPGALLSGRSFGSMSAEAFVPAVASIPFTAPFYQEAAKPKEAPEVAGCGVLKIGSHTQCRCNDQQGNVLDLTYSTCLAYFERGAFRPSRPSVYPVHEPYVPPLAPPNDTQGPGRQADPGAAGGPGLDQQKSGLSNS